MNELEQIVQRMIDANEPEEAIAAVIKEYNSNNKTEEGKTSTTGEDTTVDVDAVSNDPWLQFQQDMGSPSVDGSLDSQENNNEEGEFTYGDQRDLEQQIIDYKQLSKDILNGTGNYSGEEFKKYTKKDRENIIKNIPEPKYVEVKISELNDLEEYVFTPQAQKEINKTVAKSQEKYNKNLSQLEEGLTTKQIRQQRASTLFSDLYENDPFLKTVVYPEITKAAEPKILQAREAYTKKYNLNANSTSQDILNANNDFQEEANFILEQTALDNKNFVNIRDGLSDIASSIVDEDMAAAGLKTARAELEFKIPFTDITLYKGISDYSFIEGLQQFGKQATGDMYGLELMGESTYSKNLVKEISAIKEKIESGQITENDQVDYEVTVSKKSNTLIGKKTGTAKQAIEYLQSKLTKQTGEQFDTLVDIDQIEKDLSIFNKVEIFDKDGVTWRDLGQLSGSQLPQMGLAMVAYGVGASAQMTASTYINNLDIIAKKEFSIPDGVQPTYEQLLEVINSDKDQQALALAVGTVGGQLERISAKGLFKPDIGKAVGSLVRGETRLLLQSAKKTGKRMIEGGLAEAVTETLQTGGEQMAGIIVGDGSGTFDFKGLKEAAGQGGIMGALIPGGMGVMRQSSVEFKQAAMKSAAALGMDNSYAKLEQHFKDLELNITKANFLSEKDKRERVLALGQIRNTVGKLSKDLNADQREEVLDLLITKQNINSKFQDVAPELIPKSAKDAIEKINNDISSIAETAYITSTVDMAMKEGLGENMFSANTTAEADALAADNDMSMVDSEGQRSEGAFSADGKTVIIDLEQAKKVGAFNVAGHELLHRVLFNTLYKEVDGKLVGSDVARSLGLELDKQLDKINPSILKNAYLKSRLELYKNEGKSMLAEEKLTILSDALRLGAITIDETGIDKFNSYFRRLFQNLGWKKIKFKDGKSVVNFIQDYNKSLDKGALGKSIKQGAEEGFEVVRGKDGIKKLKDDFEVIVKQSRSEDSSNEVQRIYETKGVDGSFDIIEQFKPITSKIVEKRSQAPGFDRQLLTDEIETGKRGIIDLIREYNPSSGVPLAAYVNKFLPARAIEASRRILGEEFTDDVTEAKGLAAEEVAVEVAPTDKQVTSKLRRVLGIKQGDAIYNLAKEISGEILSGNLPSKKVKTAINKEARKSKLRKAVSDLMGTEKAIDQQFLNKNILEILKALPASDLVKLEREVNTKVLAKQGPRLNVKDSKEAVNKGLLPKDTNLQSGPKVSSKLPTTLEQAKEFFTQKRKAGLVNVITEMLVKDAAPEVTEGQMEPAKRAKVLSEIDRAPTLKFSKTSLEAVANLNFEVEAAQGRVKVDGLLNHYGLKNTLLIKNKEDIKSYIERIKKDVFPLLPRSAFFGPSGGTAFTSSSKIFGLSSQKNEDGTTKKDKNGKSIPNDLWVEIVKEFKSLNQPTIDGKVNPKYLKDSDFGKDILDANGKAIDFKIKSYSTLFKNPDTIKKNIENGEINKFNTKIGLIHKVLWERINEAVSKDKSKATGIATYLRITANDTNHWHKQGAAFVGYSTNPIGKTNSKGNTTLYEFEHAMPATAAYLYLLDVALSKSNFKAAYKVVMDNYKLIALDKSENAKLGKAKLGTGMPKGWKLGENFWWQRYFNPQVAAIDGGIPTNSLNFLDGKNFNEELNVNSSGEPTTPAVQEYKSKASKSNNDKLPKPLRITKDFNNQMVLDVMSNIDNKSNNEEIKFSKSLDLNKDFNDIIENKTGIASDKTYARVKAEVAGANKGKFNFFIPPSAEDFVGLLYSTLGKGSTGDAQMAWYKAHLLNPFARAMENVANDRAAMMQDFRGLKKALKIVPKDLRRKIPGEPFTKEQAVRAYIWDKQGMNIPGLSQKDQKDLVDYIKNDSELIVFADQLIDINKGDAYAAPDDGWIAGTIDTDFLKALNTTKRSKYLEVWQQNVDQIFSETNLNKLEAAYGKPYRVAMENILHRMETGRNRSFGTDTITGRFTDWLTNSVGAIMFFNTRSAVLQTISAVNFINFSDNNPLKAGQAFANQPQYWSDFKKLFNSPFLLDRRSGIKLNVNEADIAEMAKGPGNSARNVIAGLLKIGFLPTQLADSFAIASGGASFYRNRIKALKKEGLTDAEAEETAFRDFREIAEESQQSSRPDKISQQQAGPLGRIVLAFANTPAQYARLIKKAASDLKNRRGDAKTNISKIIYYGVAQNILFSALQQALFAISFGDEDDEEEKRNEKYFNIANGMSDSILRGIGVGGAIASVVKNTAIRLAKEADKKAPKYQDAVVKGVLQISPPISSKVGKLQSAGRSLSWNKKEMMTKGWAIDNPAYLASANVISAITNVPLDRAVKKVTNLVDASNEETEYYKRIALALGWSAWELDIEKEKFKKSKPKSKPKRKRTSSTKRRK